MVSAPIIFMNCRHQQILGIFPGDVLYCSNFTFCLFWASAFSLWNTCSVGLRSSDRLGRSWTSCCLAREKKCFGCMFRISALLHCPQIVELFLTSWSRFYLNKKLTPHVFIGISWASFMTVCVCFSCLPASRWMNMAETGDGKQTRQQICDRGRRSDPFLWITEHGSNWKQTSKAHPPSSPHAQLHPQQSISIFAHHAFWNCILKTNGKSVSNGRKTNNRSAGERGRGVSSARMDLQWKQ